MVLHHIIENSTVALAVDRPRIFTLRIEQALRISLGVTADFDSGDIGLIRCYGSLPAQQLLEALCIGGLICYSLLHGLIWDLLDELRILTDAAPGVNR